MKKIAIVIGILLVIIGLVETIDLSFYLMNRPDTYLFNSGLVLLGLQLLGFAYICRFMFDLVSKGSKDKETEITTEEPKKPKKKNKNNLKQEKK
jgi:uncharacterized membrane protein YczE